MKEIENLVEEHKALMVEWKKKYPVDAKFIEDGIVNPDIWHQQENRILFFLKEAYGASEFSLTKALNENTPFYTTWKPTAVLINTLLETTPSYIPTFQDLEKYKEDKDVLKKIAVVNIKKVYGTSSSKEDNLEIYLKQDFNELQKQIKFINPTIIVCGGTKKLLDKHNFWAGFEEVIGTDQMVYTNQKTVLIDFWHPSYRVSHLMMHYTLGNIYQKYLQLIV